jgi:hypothetical protein
LPWRGSSDEPPAELKFSPASEPTGAGDDAAKGM